jgi:gluconate 2-dehydrogenase gamma chain
MISRRDLLKAAGAAIAATEATAATPARRDVPSNGPIEAPPPASVPPGHDPPHDEQSAPRVPLEALTADEADLLTAIVARLIPNDANGPGAVEAGAVHYIDRALAGALSSSRETYRRGLAALERYARSSRGKPFRELAPGDQESLLIDVETGSATGSGAGFEGSSAAFFAMLRAHTWQGTFGDPFYGGNRDFIGWDLLGYPGVRTAVTPDDQRLGVVPVPLRRSAYDSDMFNKATAGTNPKGSPHGDDAS